MQCSAPSGSTRLQTTLTPRHAPKTSISTSAVNRVRKPSARVLKASPQTSLESAHTAAGITIDSNYRPVSIKIDILEQNKRGNEEE